MKFDEARIQYHLSRYVVSKNHEFVIPNVSWSWLYWEADLISVTRHWYCYEYEIKITRQDFEKDFGKRKHLHLRNPRDTNKIPNYFSYVAPIEAIPLCIPDYAGLIEVRQSGRYGQGMVFEEIRKPMLLHRTIQSKTGLIRMLRTIMFKYWNLAQTLEENKVQRQIEMPD